MRISTDYIETQRIFCVVDPVISHCFPVSSSSSSSVGGRGGGRKVKSIDGDMNEHMRQLRGWLGRILDHSKENIQPESSLLDHHLIDSDDGCLTVGGGVICPSQLLQVLH
uniref:Uncharacterized protein n=1 Tax=Echinococcus granulosus TaxID=6210 RepID=A0A068WV39_ECHGR|nr:hypothetical protein EgrG_002029500 [Echinococcus granulosus]